MNRSNSNCCAPVIGDYGPDPLILNMNYFARKNSYYRTALWTGTHLQITLMSIPVHGDIGLELHSDVDQFICIEEGCALVMMGEEKTRLNCRKRIRNNFAVIIPAGMWHNIVNVGNCPLKLYSIYAPPQHPFGTLHPAKEMAETAENP